MTFCFLHTTEVVADARPPISSGLTFELFDQAPTVGTTKRLSRSVFAARGVLAALAFYVKPIPDSFSAESMYPKALDLSDPSIVAECHVELPPTPAIVEAVNQ